MADVNHDRYQIIQYSPSLQFANAITILSGKIFVNHANGLWFFNSFSSELWLLITAVFFNIAIFDRILHHGNTKWTLYLVGVVVYYLKLWLVFINQSIQLGNICCVKHLILNSVTVISIFVMTQFIESEILSKLLFHPLLKIDTLDDLIQFVTQHDDVKLISDNLTTSWSILRNWEDERARFIFPKMTSVPISEFDYQQVYHGKSIIISYDDNFEKIIKSHRDLSFHISSDRLFGKQHGFLYSKYIDIETKRSIDTIISSLLENGIHNFVEEKKRSKRLNIEENDPSQSISFTYFKRIMRYYTFNSIWIIVILIIECVFYNLSII